MNLGSVVVEYKPTEREVWVTASGLDDGAGDGDPAAESATVAFTPREALGLAWLLIRAAIFRR